MADTKISDLSAASALAGTEVLPIVQSGSTVKATVQSIADLGAASDDFIYLNADYTLTSTTSAQQLFNTTTNGRLTLTTGIYAFDALIVLTAMSATSGNGRFGLLGAGTATLSNAIAQVVGVDNNSPDAGGPRGGCGMFQANITSGSNMIPPGVGTGMMASISGLFMCTGAGTIIPSITLTTAAAAIVEAGSYFRIRRLADSTTYSVGAWD